MRTQDHRVLITDTNLIPGHTYEIVVAARTRDGRLQAFEEAPRALVTLAGKADLPAAPTALAAEASFQNIFLTWTRPGDPDIDAIEIYRFTSDDRESAVKIGETKADSFVDNIGAPNLTRYYWLRSRNRTGTQSDWNASAGVSATTAEVAATDIEDFAITATKLNTNTVVLSGDAWTDNSPSAGYIAWNAHTVVYGGVAYAITAGNTNKKYVYWAAGGTSYTTADSHPSLGNTNFMIVYNRSGVAELVWNSAANMVIGTAWIADASITNAKINDLSADKINTGTLNAAIVTVSNLTATMIAAGTLTGSTIQTASSGQRTVISTADHTLRMYNSGGANTISLLYDSSVPSLDMADSTNGAQIKLTKDASDYATLQNNKVTVVSSLSSPSVDAVGSNATHNTGVIKASVTGSGGGYLFYGEDASDNRVFGVTSGGRVYVGENLEVTGSVDTADKYTVDGTQVVTNRQTHIANPSGGGTQDAEARTAINSILSLLETHGLMATS